MWCEKNYKSERWMLSFVAFHPHIYICIYNLHILTCVCVAAMTVVNGVGYNNLMKKLCFKTSFQVIINVIWMIISPARAMHHYPTREDNLLVCDSYVDASYMIAFSYPIFLIVICTVYAVLTRKIPEAFNESKHIGEWKRVLMCSMEFGAN